MFVKLISPHLYSPSLILSIYLDCGGAELRDSNLEEKHDPRGSSMNNQHIRMEALKGKSLIKRLQYEQSTHQDGEL